MNADLDTLRDRLRAFALARDWGQFHSPKNLACALSVEAAELLEHFQWMTEEQSRAPDAVQHAEIALEAADVLLYLIQLADQLGIDLLAAADRKIALNAAKYPIESARGNSRKPAGRVVRPSLFSTVVRSASRSRADRGAMQAGRRGTCVIPRRRTCTATRHARLPTHQSTPGGSHRVRSSERPRLPFTGFGEAPPG